MDNSLKRLEDACRDVARDIREIELKKDNLNNDISSLEAKKSKLSLEVDGYSDRVNEVRIKIQEERKRMIDEIDANLRRSSDLKADIELEKAILSQKQVEIDKLKTRLEYQIAENERAGQELVVKTKIVEEKLAEIEAFRAKITN